jgi:hypothetical protein
MRCSDGCRALGWLTVAVIASGAVVGISMFVLDAYGRDYPYGRTGAGHTYYFLYKGFSGWDSWVPMLYVYGRKTEDPSSGIYDAFFQSGVKFQYPPSSLLIFDLIPRPLTTLDPQRRPNPVLDKWLNRVSAAAVFLTVLTCIVIMEVQLRQLNPRPGGRLVWSEVALTAVRGLLAAVLGLTFYPLLQGYALGQIQIVLDCLVALAILFYLLEWDLLSGACLGLCCLVKPQYGIILLWPLLTRRWRLAASLAAVFALGTVVATVRFGVKEYVDYFRVLRAIAGSGEAYWPNQSMNGLMNRLLENGNVVEFHATNFAPYHPAVYAVTLVSSLVILALALRPWRLRQTASRGSAGLLVMVVAATMASPVAWDHHYGVLLPVFAAAMPGLIRFRPLGRFTAPLFAISYLMATSSMHDPEAVKLFFSNRWLGLVESHLFFGGLILFVLLLALRRAEERPAPVVGISIPPAGPGSSRGT